LLFWCEAELSSTTAQQLENHSTKYHRQQPLYNTLELLMMGILVPETIKQAIGSLIKTSVASSWHFISTILYTIYFVPTFVLPCIMKIEMMPEKLKALIFKNYFNIFD